MSPLKNFLRQNGIWVLILSLLLTAAISVGTVFLPNLTAPVTNLMGLVATPFRSVASFFVDKVESAYDYAFRYQALKSRVEELEAQVAQLSADARDAEDALEENQRLRELLNLAQAHTDFVFESATVTARSSSSWSSTLTLSKGSASGLAEKMCVVTENGYLVGVITSVGINTATVTTLIDPTISIGMVASASEDSAILTSNLDSMLQGLCRLSYLGSDASLIVGDTVITSGLGGVYPAGLVVGTITEAGMSVSGMEQYAIVSPAVNLDSLKQVFVIKDFDIEE